MDQDHARRLHEDGCFRDGALNVQRAEDRAGLEAVNQLLVQTHRAAVIRQGALVPESMVITGPWAQSSTSMHCGDAHPGQC